MSLQMGTGTNSVEVIAGNAPSISYATGGSAVKAGYQINNTDVYVKRVNFGALPNTNSKNVDTGITVSGHTIVNVVGIANNGSSYVTTLPSISVSAIASNISIGMDASGTNYAIQISVGSNRSAWSAVVDVYYY